MKDLDFLPEWYKDRKRRQQHVRRQYVALVGVFLLMMIFNGTAIHRAGKAAAEATKLENQRVGAEAVVHEFDALTQRLNELKTRTTLVEQIDPRIDVAAILAETSHIIGDSIVLRKVEILSEPFGRPQENAQVKGSAVRLANKRANSEKEIPLGRVKFRIVLAGVATRLADVADLVCKLDASPYFQRVHPSFYGNAKVQVGGKVGSASQEGAAVAKAQGALDLTEFEISCYLGNYKELEE